jgi:hypothetical protein
LITRDHGRGSIVVVCRRCGARDLFNYELEAARWESDHIERHAELERRDLERRRAVAAAASRRRRRDTPTGR